MAKRAETGTTPAGTLSGSDRDEVVRYERVAKRLHDAFDGLMGALPEQARTVSEMARYLDLGRGVCQRVVLALRAKGDAIESLERFPGVRGLEQLIEAAQARGMDERRVAAAVGAVDEYAALIGAAGGSQRRLLKEISAAQRRGDLEISSGRLEEDESERVETRRALYESARDLMGTSCEARVEVQFIRPMPDRPTMLETAIASGVIGMHAERAGVPIVRVTRNLGGGKDNEDTRAHEMGGSKPILGVGRNSLIEEFSTTPLPSVTTRNSMGEQIQVFNPEGASQKPLDILVGMVVSPGSKHPLEDDPSVINVSTMVTAPTRRFICDVYLERSLAQASVPMMSVFRPGFTGSLGHRHPDDQWFDRLPEEPALEVLGPGLARREAKGYPRMRELAEHICERTGWSAERFVCFRCEVEYPMWSAQYVLTFDFGESPDVQIPRAFRRRS